jgi:hypothetical protein
VLSMRVLVSRSPEPLDIIVVGALFSLVEP